MAFETYFKRQMKEHSMQPRDVAKLCYQAAFGAEHLLEDLEGARTFFQTEYAAIEETKEALYEQISDEICRVNMGAWKKQSLPSEWLFSMFVASAKVAQGEKLLPTYLTIADKLIREQEENCTFSMEEWQAFWQQYQAQGMPAVHHSEAYRKTEKPAYRIVNSRFIKCIPILQRMAKVQSDACAEETRQQKALTLAMDGPCASGKTTLAEQLKEILGVEVVHMDDFFVPPVLRSKERFAQAGGNVHYERFMEEVLPNIAKQEAFSYRIFACSKMDYEGRREINQAPWRIVEGSYSMHPKFGDYADVKLYCDISEELQKERILKRNGTEMAKRFENEWIPMENHYFQTFQIKEKADILLNAE